MNTKTPNSKLQAPSINRVSKIWNLVFGIWKFQKGFTLVEILLYMGLLAILLVVLTEILVSILAVKIEFEATSSVEQDSRFLLSRLFYDINRASAITTPGSIGSS